LPANEESSDELFPLLMRARLHVSSASSGIKAAVWLSDSELLVMENSFTGGGVKRNSGRMFILTSEAIFAATDVTSCSALADGKCAYAPVHKRLAATIQESAAGTEDYFLAGATRGPDLQDGRALLVTTEETSSRAGARLLAFAVDLQTLQV